MHLIILVLSVCLLKEPLSVQSTFTQLLAGQADPPRLITFFATDNFSLSLVDLYHFTTHVSQRLMVYSPPPHSGGCVLHLRFTLVYLSHYNWSLL